MFQPPSHFLSSVPFLQRGKLFHDPRKLEITILPVAIANNTVKHEVQKPVYKTSL